MNIIGKYKVKCVKPGGITLTTYNDHHLSENQVLDLLDENLPSYIKAANWSVADTMCKDSDLEIAQAILAGDIVVVEKKMPEPVILRPGE